MNRPKVSVIIPVYNAAKYIERSSVSLFEQTLDNLEYIFIDDHGRDNSIDLLKEIVGQYPNRQNQVKIIRNNENLGVGQSRQKGVDEATGEYLIHCDTDDWIEPDMYESLYKTAKSESAEIAICDFYKDSDTSRIFVKQNPESDKSKLFSQISKEILHMNLWQKLILSDLAKSVRIEPGIDHWEDLSVVPYMMLKSKKTVKVNRALYHYNVANTNSITRADLTQNAISSISALNSLLKKLNASGFIDIIDPLDIYRLQWSAKKGFLLEPSKENIKLWQETFPESNRHYKEIGISRKFQFLTWLAIHNHYKSLQFYKKLKSIL